MNVVRINSKNVIFLFMALLSTSVQEARMDYGTATSYALKEANVNSTPAYSSKKEEMASLCPSGIPCVELSGECLKCNLNYSCRYGATYEANCSVMEHVDCIGEQTFTKKYICRYCYQTDHWEHQCHQKNSCSSVASPQQYYRTNCTVNNDILCLGRRKFMKNLPCNWTVGYRWSTALILSITLGGFGADRFYLGHWQEGIGKLFSFGGLGVWTLIDVILISMRYLGPADGSLYI
ncbi:PREDICTED: TM2 domain-containing protein almondex [Trachymyrmex cornetzi]|uniref:TM2 domain-containing protein almondex n=1 Tax=Trachymyrmex cornetzi TaxID=471704 RepID=A0A195D9X0_9HYME|nr:PREDICTED: TM2 domain-containing protein almondex [Trachymyrmex cornetzi]KYN09657.1 TM2 domain-containing protein almondex [Trachymyrmex cornetzi]